MGGLGVTNDVRYQKEVRPSDRNTATTLTHPY